MSVKYHSKIPDIIDNADNAANGILRVAAMNIKSASSDYVPVQTGNLRNSVYIRSEHLRVTIGYGANYASFVEFGTRRMAARPYLSRAFFEEVPRLKKAMKKVVQP